MQKIAYRLPEAAEATGLSVDTLRRLINRRELPSAKIGACIVIHHDDLDALIRAHVRNEKPGTNYREPG